MTVGGDPVDEAATPATTAPRTYLGWALASTILCFLPTGLVALWHGWQVTKAVDEGSAEAAERASARARAWVIITVVVGVLVWLFLAVAFAMLGAFSR